MKNSPLITVLLALLTLSAVLSLGLFYRNVAKTREVRFLQSVANKMTVEKSIAGGIVPEAIEYSKTHPDLEQVLEAAGLKPKAALSNPKPTTK
jgi:hypothetical protein